MGRLMTKSAPPSRSIRHRNLPTMSFDDRPADRQPQTDAPSAVGRYRCAAKEFVEDFLFAAVWNARPIVGNVNLNMRLALATAGNLDRRCRLVCTEKHFPAD